MILLHVFITTTIAWNVFKKLCMKDDMIFGPLLDLSLSLNFKTMEMNMIVDFYGLQMPRHIIWTLIK
jgi:hypothetical protein